MGNSMQSDNCKEFYETTFNLLETVVIRIKLSTMDSFVSKPVTVMEPNDIVPVTYRALARNPGSMSASCEVV